ncbi:hypothetical protein FNYG_05975 [Fusarium nygamai]|uniref:Uncharacterized protein n=1 Tax=Gibberella nygamai TaxID=42673 RepID=A0A2K0WDN5_GIBNY|nr:hypothetical protein FNYG_05975 [Fusarium nygamai]
MAQREQEERDIWELAAICEDLFQKYASAEPGCSAPQKSAARQQQRFSTIVWALFTHSETPLDLDVIRPLASRQIYTIRTRLEFAALHDTKFHSSSEVLSSLKDIQRRKWIKQLEGTPSDALGAVKEAIDRLEQLGKVILQHSHSEVPTNERGMSLKSTSGASIRQSTGKVVTKTHEPSNWPSREKGAGRKQAHISSMALVPSRQISPDDSAIDMSNDWDQSGDHSTPSSMGAPRGIYDGSEAENVHEGANHSDSRLSSPEEGQTVRSKVQTAKELFHQFKYKEAEADYRKILEEYPKFMKDDKSSIILVEGNLANALAKQGKYDKAEALYKKVRALSDGTYGEASSQALACKSNLASIWEKGGKQEKAVEMYREVLELRKKAEPEGLETLSSSNKLANALMRQAKYGEATDIYTDVYKKMLGTHKDEFGEKHPKTIITLGNLVASLQNQGRSIGNRDTYLESMKLGLEVLDLEHPCREWFETRYKELEGSRK